MTLEYSADESFYTALDKWIAKSLSGKRKGPDFEQDYELPSHKYQISLASPDAGIQYFAE